MDKKDQLKQAIHNFNPLSMDDDEFMRFYYMEPSTNLKDAQAYVDEIMQKVILQESLNPMEAYYYNLVEQNES